MQKQISKIAIGILSFFFAVAPLAHAGEHGYDFAAYAGLQANPGNAALALSADVHASQWLSFGPLLQLGLWDERTFVTTTVGGKVHVAVLDNPQIEVNVSSGVGYFYQRDHGFTFDNFVFTAGPGIDYFFLPRWAASALMLLNVSNDPVDDLFFSGLIGVKYVLD